MPHEILYTSAPRGLKPGSQGFCTVVSSMGIPTLLAEKLESLSGYRQVYTGDQASLNPVNHTHVALTISGRKYHVLSAVRDAGQDYTQRSNKLAHHVALESGELPPAGAAALLATPGFCEAIWNGEPRLLPAARKIPAVDRPVKICQAWTNVTGDAGWAGVLAETVLQHPARPTVLVFPPGLEVLPLVVEAVALLPADRRWEATFSTYFTKASTGTDCLWRFVLEGTPEAQAARRTGPVWDLTRPMDRAQGGSLVNTARTGIAVRVEPASLAGRAPAAIKSSPDPFEGDKLVEPPPIPRQRTEPVAPDAGRWSSSGGVNLSADTPTQPPVMSAPASTGRPAVTRPPVIVVRAGNRSVIPIVAGVVALLLTIPLTIVITLQLTRRTLPAVPVTKADSEKTLIAAIEKNDDARITEAVPPAPMKPARTTSTEKSRVPKPIPDKAVPAAEQMEPTEALANNAIVQPAPLQAGPSEPARGNPPETPGAKVAVVSAPSPIIVPPAVDKKFVVLGSAAAASFHESASDSNAVHCLKAGDELYVPSGASVRIDAGRDTFVTVFGTDVFGTRLVMDRPGSEEQPTRIKVDDARIRIEWAKACGVELETASDSLRFPDVDAPAVMVLELAGPKVEANFLMVTPESSDKSWIFRGKKILQSSVEKIPEWGRTDPKPGMLPGITAPSSARIIGTNAGRKLLGKLSDAGGMHLTLVLMQDALGNTEPLVKLLLEWDDALDEKLSQSFVWILLLDSIVDSPRFLEAVAAVAPDAKDWLPDWDTICKSELEPAIEAEKPGNQMIPNAEYAVYLQRLLDWSGDNSRIKRALSRWKLRRIAVAWDRAGKNADSKPRPGKPPKYPPMPNPDSTSPSEDLPRDFLTKWNAWIVHYIEKKTGEVEAKKDEGAAGAAPKPRPE